MPKPVVVWRVESFHLRPYINRLPTRSKAGDEFAPVFGALMYRIDA
jgi:hypothetical protein